MRVRSTPLCLALLLSFFVLTKARAQDDGGLSTTDGGGQTLLESINVPELTGAPFSLVLSTEWARSLFGGGTFTIVNSRPIKHDSAGRIYQERWLLAPKGSKIPSRMSWIQIEDPVAHTYLECNPHSRKCELHALHFAIRLYDPSRFRTGPIPGAGATVRMRTLAAMT